MEVWSGAWLEEIEQVEGWFSWVHFPGTGTEVAPLNQWVWTRDMRGGLTAKWQAGISKQWCWCRTENATGVLGGAQLVRCQKSPLASTACMNIELVPCLFFFLEGGDFGFFFNYLLTCLLLSVQCVMNILFIKFLFFMLMMISLRWKPKMELLVQPHETQLFAMYCQPSMSVAWVVSFATTHLFFHLLT